MNELIQACKDGRLNDVERLLEDSESALDPCHKDENGWTPLHHASQNGHLPVVEYLLDKDADPSAESSEKEKITPLHLACVNNHVDVVSRLLRALPPGVLMRKSKDGNTVLHFACKAGGVLVVKAILELAQEQSGSLIVSTNQKGATPFGIALAQAQDAAASDEVGSTFLEVANLLLDRVTGNPSKRFKDFQNLFPTFKPTYFLDLPMKVIIVGDFQTGKSTLIKSLQVQSTMMNKLRGYALPSGIQGVDSHRVGVVPSDVMSQSMDSRVILCDLASSRAFISEKLIESEDEVATSVFVICINMQEEEKKDIRAKMLYWMSFIWHQCAQYCTAETQIKPTIIIVGRSYDLPRRHSINDSKRLTQEYNEISSIEEISQNLNLLNKFSLDCRKQSSNSLSDLRASLRKHFQSVRLSGQGGEVPSRWYILSAILESEFQHAPAIQLRDLQTTISEGSPQNRLLALLPQSPEEIWQLCQHLEERKRVLLLEDSEGCGIEDSWIIHSGHQMLTEINDALCTIPQASELTGSSALVTREHLQRCLPEIRLSFSALLQLMDYYGVCEAVTIESTADQLFYIPALLPREHDLPQWNDECLFEFAWALVPVASHNFLEFFMPRFLKFLLVRLLLFATEAGQFVNCSVWAEGITFSSVQGTVDVCVMASAQGVVLNMRCKSDDEIECLFYRNKILEQIRNAKRKYQPEIEVTELILPSTPEVHFPLKNIDSQQLHKVDVSDLKSNLMEGVDSTPEALPFFEPYNCLRKLPHAYCDVLTDLTNTNQPINTEAMTELVKCIGQKWKNLVEHFKPPHSNIDGDTGTSSACKVPSELHESVFEDDGKAEVSLTYGYLLKCLASVSILEEDSLRLALKGSLVASKSMPDGTPERIQHTPSTSSGTPTMSSNVDGLETPTAESDLKIGWPLTANSSHSGGSRSSSIKPDHSSSENLLESSPKHDNFQLIEDTEVFKCDSKGLTYKYKPHQVELYIPEGAIESRTSIEIGVTIQGTFVFSPKSTKPLSTVVMVCVEEGSKFNKPLELTLPHCFGFERDALSFFQASKPKRQTDKLLFEKVKGEAFIRGGKGILRMKPKSAPQFFCIACKSTPETIAKTNYCVIKVMPKSTNETTWQLRLYVSYFLETCIEMVRKQFGDDYAVSCHAFRFRLEANRDPAIELRFESLIGEEWSLNMDGKPTIEEQEVDYSVEDTQSQICCDRYPPMFTVTVNGEGARNTYTTAINCRGTRETLQFGITLRSPLQRVSVEGYEHHQEGRLQETRHFSFTGSQISFMSSPEESDGAAPPHSMRKYGHHGSCQSLPAVFGYHGSPNGLSDTLSEQNELADTEPTDIELDQVGKEVLGKMREDWVFLMTYLEIPNDDQTVALSKPTIRQQVWYMLRQWRDGSADNTRARLAQRLKRFDRLRRVAHRLVKGEFMI